MQTQNHLSNHEQALQKNSLFDIVKTTIESLTPAGILPHASVINDIPPSFMVDADKNKLSTLLKIILGKVFLEGADTCYRLSAKQYSNVVLFQIKDTGSWTESQSRYYPEDALQLCQTIGG